MNKRCISCTWTWSYIYIDTKHTSKGIEKLLSNLNPHKAAGHDQIKPIILKKPSITLSPILKHLFQKSLDSGTVPPIWKDPNLAPAYKKGERSNPANYISLTCILCKTLEHIVASSITKHLSKLNIFYELQHGFREQSLWILAPHAGRWSFQIWL